MGSTALVIPVSRDVPGFEREESVHWRDHENGVARGELHRVRGVHVDTPDPSCMTMFI